MSQGLKGAQHIVYSVKTENKPWTGLQTITGHTNTSFTCAYTKGRCCQIGLFSTRENLTTLAVVRLNRSGLIVYLLFICGHLMQIWSLSGNFKTGMKTIHLIWQRRLKAIWSLQSTETWIVVDCEMQIPHRQKVLAQKRELNQGPKYFLSRN